MRIPSEVVPIRQEWRQLQTLHLKYYLVSCVNATQKKQLQLYTFASSCFTVTAGQAEQQLVGSQGTTTI